MLMKRHGPGMALTLLLLVTPFCSPVWAQMSSMRDLELQIGGPLPDSPFQFDSQFAGVTLGDQQSLYWLRDALSPAENAEFADLLSRQSDLTPAELDTLKSFIDRSLTIPTTPMPQPVPRPMPLPLPIPITNPPGPPGTVPPIVTGQACPDGRQLPAICAFSTSLPDCQCSLPDLTP